MGRYSSWQPPGLKSSNIPEYGVALRHWLQQPVGQKLLFLEQQKINTIVPTLFGYNAIMLGQTDFAACLQQSTIKKRYVINEDVSCQNLENYTLLSSRQDRLAIGSGLIDVVYLAHCLEFASNPHEVLREVYRVMRADGHLILTMFNPFSLWGIWRGVAKYAYDVPWKSNFISIVKLKDWLALLGFDIMRVNYLGFNLPLGGKINKLSWLERKAQQYELPVGAVYLIEANKRVIPLTPITPVWNAQTDSIADDLTEPSV